MSKMHVDQDLIRDLAALLNETDLTEIEVADGDRKIKIVRAGAPVAAMAPALAAMAAPAVQETAQDSAESHPGMLPSPMVGTIYMAPEPGSDDFVKVGDKVAAGETILIIEAMKVMNQIHAQKAGVVTQILVEDGQPVEYGEPLVIIE